MRGGILFAMLIFLSSFSQVYANTGGILLDATVDSIENTESTQTGSVGELQNEPEILNSQNFDLPIVHTLQQPSYILSDTQNLGNYLCDNSKTECKVNFSLLESFVGISEKNYDCEIDFGFLTGEEQKCNPATVIFPYGEYDVSFKIFEKQDQRLVGQSAIHISNPIPEVQDIFPFIDIQSGFSLQDNVYVCNSTDCKINLHVVQEQQELLDSQFSCIWDFTGGTFQTSGTDMKCNPGYVQYGFGEFHIEVVIQEKKFPFREWQQSLDFQNIPQGDEQTVEQNIADALIPPIIMSMQRPSDVQLYDGEKNIYVCSPGSPSCRANFSLEETFGGYIPKKYACKIDTGFMTGEEEKCNPNTIIFPPGEHTVMFSIYEKAHPENIQTYTIYVQNTPPTSQDIGSQGEVMESISPHLIIQTGASMQSNTIFCQTQECKINFKVEKSAQKSCKWHFQDVKTSQKSFTSCNPGVVEFLKIESEFMLEIFDREGKLEKIEKFLVKNQPKIEKYASNHPPIGLMSLQGKNKNIQKFGNTIFCYTQDTCRVNLTASGSFDVDRDNISYHWDFGNGQTSDKKNPTSVDFGLGKYDIGLTLDDGIQSSFVSMDIEILHPGEIPEVLQDKNIFHSLRIGALQVNPKGQDTGEWIELENTGYTILQLQGLEIQVDEKKSFIFDSSTFLLPKSKKKFYKSVTHLTLKNTQGKVILLYDSKIIDSLEWNFPVKDGLILTRGMLKVVSQLVKVVEIIDGDTVVIQLADGTQEKLRLIGVDTPETKHPKKLVEFFGMQASEYTTKELLNKEVYLEIDTENYRDKYGRLLGYLRFEQEQKTFNQILIEEGYARAYLFFPFAYAKQFEEAEKQAKKFKLGMRGDTQMRKELLSIEKDEQKILELYDAQISDTDIFSFLFKNILFIEPQELKTVFKDILTRIHTQTQNWHQPEISQQKNVTKQQKPKSKKLPFTLQVTKLKSGLKIGGKTLSDIPIMISLGTVAVQVYSDGLGKYSHVFQDSFLNAGQNTLLVELHSLDGNILAQKQKQLDISPAYIGEVHAYLQKKLQSKLKKAKKTKKITAKKPTILKIEQNTPSNFMGTPAHNNIQIHLLILMGILSLFGFFAIYGYKLSHRHLQKIGTSSG